MTASSADAAAPARRRHDAQASREALLSAATELFDERGYEATTVRDIGERAGVDAALIARYFGGKEPLYLAMLEHKQDRVTVPADLMYVLERMLSRSEERGIGPVPLAMVSPTLTDEMREQVRAIMGRCVVAPVSETLAGHGVADAELRAEIFVAIAVGLSLTRASGTLPALAHADVAEVLAVLEAPIATLHDDGV